LRTSWKPFLIAVCERGGTKTAPVFTFFAIKMVQADSPFFFFSAPEGAPSKEEARIHVPPSPSAGNSFLPSPSVGPEPTVGPL